MEYLLEIQIYFVYMQETKEGDSPFGLSITATDFYVYVREKPFFVHGRKDKRKGGR